MGLRGGLSAPLVIEQAAWRVAWPTVALVPVALEQQASEVRLELASAVLASVANSRPEAALALAVQRLGEASDPVVLEALPPSKAPFGQASDLVEAVVSLLSAALRFSEVLTLEEASPEVWLLAAALSSQLQAALILEQRSLSAKLAQTHPMHAHPVSLSELEESDSRAPLASPCLEPPPAL